MSTKSFEEVVEELEVEFLHGVPVKLPKEAKAALLAAHKEAVRAAKPERKQLDETNGTYSPEYHIEVDSYNEAIDEYERNLIGKEE